MKLLLIALMMLAVFEPALANPNSMEPLDFDSPAGPFEKMFYTAFILWIVLVIGIMKKN